MTTITLDTLQNTLPLFLMYLFRNNLTDPLASRDNPFVYKDAPESDQSEYPYVIVESESSSNDLPTLDNTLMIPSVYTIIVRVISKGTSSIQRRDELGDEIVNLLRDPTSADADGDSIKSNYLSIQAINLDNNDMSNIDGEILRVKEINITVRYVGA